MRRDNYKDSDINKTIRAGLNAYHHYTWHSGSAQLIITSIWQEILLSDLRIPVITPLIKPNCYVRIMNETQDNNVSFVDRNF